MPAGKRSLGALIQDRWAGTRPQTESASWCPAPRGAVGFPGAPSAQLTGLGLMELRGSQCEGHAGGVLHFATHPGPPLYLQTRRDLFFALDIAGVGRFSPPPSLFHLFINFGQKRAVARGALDGSGGRRLWEEKGLGGGLQTCWSLERPEFRFGHLCQAPLSVSVSLLPGRVCAHVAARCTDPVGVRGPVGHHPAWSDIVPAKGASSSEADDGHQALPLTLFCCSHGPVQVPEANGNILLSTL